MKSLGHLSRGSDSIRSGVGLRICISSPCWCCRLRKQVCGAVLRKTIQTTQEELSGRCGDPRKSLVSLTLRYLMANGTLYLEKMESECSRFWNSSVQLPFKASAEWNGMTKSSRRRRAMADEKCRNFLCQLPNRPFVFTPVFPSPISRGFSHLCCLPGLPATQLASRRICWFWKCCPFLNMSLWPSGIIHH